jgi:molybdate/tungstate transport system permease protein
MAIPDSPFPIPDRHRPRLRHGVLTVLAALGGSLLLLFLAAPVAELIVTGGAGGLARLGRDAELRQSLMLTVMTATTATLLGVVCGTPVAYVLSRSAFRGRAVLSALLDLPLLIPHPVAGIALLLVFGRESAVGSALLTVGLRVVGSPIGIVCAMLFVSAPLYISGARGHSPASIRATRRSRARWATTPGAHSGE